MKAKGNAATMAISQNALSVTEAVNLFKLGRSAVGYQNGKSRVDISIYALTGPTNTFLMFAEP